MDSTANAKSKGNYRNEVRDKKSEPHHFVSNFTQTSHQGASTQSHRQKPLIANYIHKGWKSIKCSML